MTLELVPGERRTVRVVKRSVKADGRVTISGQLRGGGRLFLVSDGERWEGRLENDEFGKVWVLSGNSDGGTMEERERSAVLCVSARDARVAAGLPPISVPGSPDPDPGADSTLEVAEAQPIFNSLPGANGVIYLDFDGETVSGTQWNASYTNNADIVAGGAGYSNAQIQLVWETMSEDYRPFNVNVTTDRSVYDSYATNRKAMVIFTPDNEWYGVAGGVAYIDIFGSSLYDEPAWVFTDQLLSGGNPHAPFAAEAGSHEVGHNLGLRHDGDSGADYYSGHGSGATSWGPIMGAAYQVTVSHFGKGEYTDANNTEDDLAIIAASRNGLGYQVDDHSGSTGSATPVTRPGGDAVTASGLIERTADVDVFSFDTEGGALSITGTNFTTDPNLDIRLRLLDSQGGQVAIADPLTSLDATLNGTVAAGTYYLEVDGVGTGDPTTGWSDYGSLGTYTLSGTVPVVSTLTAEILSPADAGVSLPENVGLVIEGSAAGGTISWQVLQAPPGETATFSSPGTASTRCEFSGAGLYQLRLQADSGAATAEDDLFVSVEASGAAKVYANRGAAIDLGPDRNIYDIALTLSPAITDDGVPAPPSLAYDWTVLSGNGQLSDASAAQPDLTFGGPEAVSLRLVVDDGGVQTFAEVELTARFQQEVLVVSGAAITAHAPLDGLADGLWQAIGFDDTGWQSGVQGVGYDANNGPSSRRIYLPLIGMDVENAMYEVAAGCYVRIPFNLSQVGRVLGLTLRMKYDDGFVACINGIEVARGNVPNGTLAWNSLALTDRPDEAALSFQTTEFSLPPGVLVDGTNILALHGLNSSIGKNEREFVMVGELEATLKESPFLQTVSVVGDPLQRDPGDDPDGDGGDNLTEHGLGTDPSVVGGAAALTVEPGVEVRLQLPETPPDDVRYEIEETHDLAAGPWQVVAIRDGAGPWTGQAPSSTTPAGPGYVLVVFPRSTHPRAFYRLHLTLITP